MPSDAKRCSGCSEVKPPDDFYPCAKSGRQSRCIACCKARVRGRSKTEIRRDAEERFASRFWGYVSRGEPGECWEWNGYRHSFGYGMISRVGQHTMLTAHRVSWELTNGPIQDGKQVLHKCDNPPCCNPAHLFLGTHLDNMADAVAKGRLSFPVMRGESNPKARLTEGQVVEIRKRYAAGGISIRKLAAEYGVTFAPVQLIIAGKTWRHVA